MNKIGTIAAASVTAFAVGASVAGGVIVANAAAPSKSSNSGANSDRRGPGERVTGEDAQKAIDAALAAVPGTADHAHRTADGQYLVMVTTSDNKRIVVKLDANFTVVDQQEVTGTHRGPGTPATGEDRTKASEAAVAAVPGATVLEVFTRDEGGYAVIVRTDAGKKKVVLLDENFAVTSIKADKNRGRGKHHHPGKEVTGAAFSQAEAAAKAAVDGTVVDVHKKGSKYYAMVRKDDGSMVIVVMNSDFTVTDTKAFTMHQHDRQGATTTAATAA